MIFQAARLSLINLFAAETRSVFWKVLGLTLLVLVGFWLLLRSAFMSFVFPWLASFFPTMPDWAGWLGFVFAIAAGIGLALGLALLLSPVTALIAGLFLDDVAEVVEKRDYPSDPPGTAMPLGPAIASSIKFLGVVVAGNIVALFLLFVPGVNLIAFFLVNGYLLGREYFEFAASRYLGVERARAWRSRNQGRVWLAGLAIGLFLMVPFLNLLTPLFAAIFMVHYVKALMRQEAGQPAAQGAR